ncbi:hypothetical protein Taro_016391 [Colocasia esculenta]|uniref:Retrotransposon gag domain-containing protein n=1 Tax=Colocasia esculenta TaxID=4460 RepID=A0A843UND4_COLES|nr:hypothetical protein [Colocasia esculenta]
MDSDQVRYRFNGLGREISEMADRRDWGGGGDYSEESTQRMIERIWESLTDIRRRMDQQAPVPPVAVPPGDGETVSIALVPPGVEVPFVAPLPPPPPLFVVEEPVRQVEKFLRLQPPTYSGGPNPDTTKHWVHEIERVFTTMRCPATDKVVLAAYQLRGFALEWWRLKMQTTFAGRTEEAIAWPEFLDVFKDTFFPIQVQQVKREQFRTLQQGNTSVLEYQMRFMALSRYAPYVVSDNNMMVEYFIRGLRVELQNAIVPLMCKTVEEAAQRAATLERYIRTRQVGESDSGSFWQAQQPVGVSKGKAPAGPSSSGFGKWGQKLKQAFKGKGRGWGGRQQFQQEFLDCMTHPLEEKSCELVVEVPSGEFLLTSSYVDEAPIVIEGNQMPGRLYALQFRDYGIILDMDWLETYGAMLDFRKKRIRFCHPNGAVFEYQGEGEEDVSRPSSSSDPHRSGAGSAPPAV